MGCNTSKERQYTILPLKVGVSITHAFSKRIGGSIQLQCDDKILCEWRKNNNTALLTLSQDRLTASNVEPGSYEIHCTCTTNNSTTIVYAKVEQMKIPRIDEYIVQDATNDLARDGLIKVSICDLPNTNVSYLWTSGIITEEPILYDVLPGTYCVSIISQDKVPIPFYHGCNPAIVNVKNTSLKI